MGSLEIHIRFMGALLLGVAAGCASFGALLIALRATAPEIPAIPDTMQIVRAEVTTQPVVRETSDGRFCEFQFEASDGTTGSREFSEEHAPGDFALCEGLVQVGTAYYPGHGRSGNEISWGSFAPDTW